MLNSFKNIFLIISINFFIFFSFKVLAAGLNPTTAGADMVFQEGAFQRAAGFDNSVSIAGIVGGVIEAFLSLLGIIFVVLIVLAGYNWMTSGGDEEKINKAKDGIKRAIIGIIIIIGAYAITYFVFSRIQGVDLGPTP